MISHPYEDSEHWYAIYTNPRQEARADQNLKAWQVTTFAPWVRERHRIKSVYVIKPLFPRYIFARFNPKDLLHKVRFTRGVQGVVGFGGGITSISDEVMAFIQSQAGEDGFIQIREQFRAGDEVVIEDGPLKDMHGIFLRELEDDRRVMILLDTIQYQARTCIDRMLLRNLNTVSQPRLLAASVLSSTTRGGTSEKTRI